jgi:hypothetical protein
MSALQAETPSGDPFVRRLDEILEEFATAVRDGSPISDGVRIDRIARLEKLRAVTAALQAAESVRFAQSQVAEQLAADVHPTAIGRGIAEQIGLACRLSPVVAARRLNTARAWWFELPDTYSQLSCGELSERVAETIVTETRHLDPGSATRWMNNSKLPGSASWGSRRRQRVSAKPPMRLTGTATCSGAAPNVTVAGSGCGQHPTPWLCSPATCPSNKESPATPHSNNTPTQRSRPGTAGAGIRSWPTPSWNASPDKPTPPMSTLNCTC